MPRGKIPKQVYLVKVDYSKILKEMVTSGQYDHVGVNSEACNQVEIELICFGRTMKPKDVPHRLDKIGLRLSQIEEFLAFGAAFPNVQRLFPIVTLVKGWQFRLSFCGAPDPWSQTGWRELIIDRSGSEENELYSLHDNVRFAAVKK